MPSLNWRTATCAAAAMLAACVSAALAVVSGTPVPDSDHQYDAVGLVVTVGIPGIGGCGGFISGTCTLIGPDIVMMARHSVAGSGLPANGGQTHRIRFRRGANGGVTNGYTGDCSQPFQEIYIAEFFGVDPSVDIVLGRLETRPVGITPIPAAPSFIPRGGETITLAGWGYDGLCLQSGNAWALRTKTAALPSNPSWGQCCFMYNRASFLGSGCVSDTEAARWAIGNMHDSGSPILTNITVNGHQQLSVIGIVQSQSGGVTTTSWNAAGGLPQLPLPTEPVNCPGDFNHSGLTTVQDIFDFLDAYFTGNAIGDANGDGVVTVQDMFAFMQIYFSGCP